jgi:Fur family ferric uptake transcriptional regulator
MERMTLQRQAVLHAFEQGQRPLSPAEVLAQANEMAPSLNMSTVYRQIKAMLAEGGLREVHLPGQAPRYEAQEQGEHDHHRHYFQCTSCDKVYPVVGCPGHIEQLAPPGFKVSNHYLVLEGLCADCASEAPQAA